MLGVDLICTVLPAAQHMRLEDWGLPLLLCFGDARSIQEECCCCVVLCMCAADHSCVHSDACAPHAL